MTAVTTDGSNGTGSTSNLIEDSTTTDTPLPGDGTTTGPVDETMDSSTASPPQETPLLVFFDGPMFDFGDEELGESSNSMFVVTNEGEAPASDLMVQAVAEGFSVVSNTCDGTVLNPGDSCEVRVSFDPSLFGVHTTNLVVSYLNPNAGEGLDAGLTLLGRGIGVTGNLVMNGGGADGDMLTSPPSGGWENVNGLWWTTSDRYLSGSRCIFANRGGIGIFELRQRIDLAALTTSEDGSTLRVRLHAAYCAAGAGTDEDEAWVGVRLIGGGVAISQGANSPRPKTERGSSKMGIG